ncbi:hypothetical protein LH29_08275 [Draconibacterium sediminis]|uniref:Uncharacterized protein n=1 Tax=Draconibacterium sediminis TaxID=1544798 RepID=A0A0D8JEN9_9BACT|nr:hypothetical protein LH29_08275 [Draconibacterium sediminis]
MALYMRYLKVFFTERTRPATVSDERVNRFRESRRLAGEKTVAKKKCLGLPFNTTCAQSDDKSRDGGKYSKKRWSASILATDFRNNV